jgi:hypothetical protein
LGYQESNLWRQERRREEMRCVWPWLALLQTLADDDCYTRKVVQSLTF